MNFKKISRGTYEAKMGKCCYQIVEYLHFVSAIYVGNYEYISTKSLQTGYPYDLDEFSFKEEFKISSFEEAKKLCERHNKLLILK